MRTDRSRAVEGDQGLGLGDGTGVLQDLAELDALAEQLSQVSCRFQSVRY